MTDPGAHGVRKYRKPIGFPMFWRGGLFGGLLLFLKRKKDSFFLKQQSPQQSPVQKCYKNISILNALVFHGGWDISPNNPPGSAPIAYLPPRDNDCGEPCILAQIVSSKVYRGVVGLRRKEERSDIKDCWAWQIHASGVLRFSFGRGGRPRAKLSPRTERSNRKQ